MKLDTFILNLGIAHTEIGLTEEQREVLVLHAENALRGGVSLSLTEWCSLGEDSQSAFITAGDRLRALNAYLTGSCARSKTEGLAILSQADGGDAFIRELLVQTTKVASDRIEKTRPVKVEH